MKELTLTLSKASAFDICKNALSACDINIDEQSPDKNFIKGSTDISFFSFGNKIEITLTESGQNTSVIIHSKSAAVLQLVDWGKNAELEERIAENVLHST